MSCVRGLQAAALVLALAAGALLTGGASSGAAEARGILGGVPHTVRIRPVVSDAFAEAKRPTRTARATAAAAVAACTAGDPSAFRAAPSASADDDPTASCVVARERGAPRSDLRLLLGPAGLTGNDVESVSVMKRGARKYALSLQFVESRAQALDEFASAHFHDSLAVTLDGVVVASFRIDGEPAFETMNGGLWFHPAKGFPRGTAERLRDVFAQSRHEQLAGLLESATMTATARGIVASVDATIDDKSRFVDDCPVRETPDSLVLGCFGRGTLRILRVDRADLAPVMVVTAAHEMLHGAYLELDRAARRRLDRELERVYAGIDDPDLTQLVAKYAVTEPGHRRNELHSLLGTQVEALSPMLERHYRRYLLDRTKVVAAFRSYDQVFTDLERRESELRAQLDTMHAELDDVRAQLDAAAARSDDLGAQIDGLRAQGRIGESNDLVGPQNEAATQANALVARGQELTTQYNVVVDQYNQVIASVTDLYDSINALPAEPAAS